MNDGIMRATNHLEKSVSIAISHHLVLTILADDRPGIVERVAQAVTTHDGSWTRSSMTRLGGKFAGLLLVDIDASRKRALVEALESLDQKPDAIRVLVDESQPNDSVVGPQTPCPRTVEISIVANDRQGIVGEIARLLAAHAMNLESLDSFCESAPMAAGNIFHAHATIKLPEGMSRTRFTELLESLSDDLMMEIQSKD